MYETHHRKYNSELHQFLKHQFVGSEMLPYNNSYEQQDMFVLSILDGKKNGTYLEIGGGDPVQTNNTYILEKFYGWKGLSLEYDTAFEDGWRQNRTNPILFTDALALDYYQLLKQTEFETVIDYLSCDIWPARATFDVFKLLPHHAFKFRVITFEHEAYYSDDGKQVREESREYLKNLGYELVINDIGNRWGTEQYSAEDWYVNPELVNSSIVDKLKSVEFDRVIVNRCMYTNSVW